MAAIFAEKFCGPIRSRGESLQDITDGVGALGQAHCIRIESCVDLFGQEICAELDHPSRLRACMARSDSAGRDRCMARSTPGECYHILMDLLPQSSVMRRVARWTRSSLRWHRAWTACAESAWSIANHGDEDHRRKVA